MTDIAPDFADAVTKAVSDLHPRLRREGVRAILIILAALGLGGGAIALIFDRSLGGDDNSELVTYVAVAVFVVIVAAWKWAVHTQEALVMPVLAQAIGLTHDKLAGSFIFRLPQRLLPKGERNGEDYVTGRLGAHTIQMAELTVETGGKDSRTLFRGIVAQFDNRQPIPAFLLAPVELTDPGLFGGSALSTEGLVYLRNTLADDKTYGLWVPPSAGPEPRALAPVVRVLTGIESQLGSGFRFYSATSDGEQIHIAVSHHRNLFRLRGLIPSRDKLFTEVQSALADLTVPLTLARLLIEAEAKAGATA